MDAVTKAVIGALAAGTGSAAGQVAKNAIVNGHDGLKTLLKNKYGDVRNVAEAIEKLERNPDAKGRQQSVADKLEALNTVADPVVLAALHALLDQLKSSPSREQHIQQVKEDFNVGADSSSSVSAHTSGSVSSGND